MNKDLTDKYVAEIARRLQEGRQMLIQGRTYNESGMNAEAVAFLLNVVASDNANLEELVYIVRTLQSRIAAMETEPSLSRKRTLH